MGKTCFKGLTHGHAEPVTMKAGIDSSALLNISLACSPLDLLLGCGHLTTDGSFNENRYLQR
jgi:hypothetical protein